MNAKLLVLVTVLVAFSIQTAHALLGLGLIGFFEEELATLSGRQVFVDLVIACTLILFWMINDARERGRTWLPYAALTLMLGSIGPLAYLIARELGERSRSSAPVRA